MPQEISDRQDRSTTPRPGGYGIPAVPVFITSAYLPLALTALIPWVTSSVPWLLGCVGLIVGALGMVVAVQHRSPILVDGHDVLLARAVIGRRRVPIQTVTGADVRLRPGLDTARWWSGVAFGLDIMLLPPMLIVTTESGARYRVLCAGAPHRDMLTTRAHAVAVMARGSWD